MDELLKLSLAELILLANQTREKYISQEPEACAIVNAKSGSCGQDCKFCAQSSHHASKVTKYPLKNSSEIVNAAKKAKDIGAKKFGIVTSGNSLNEKELDIITSAIRQIKKTTALDVCASLGALKRSDFAVLKDAGLSRYHHNIETSPRFYKQVVSTHDFQERVNTIKNAKAAGLEVCSGGIIGMGESWQDRMDMALILKELEVDSVPLNVLVPIKGTPFESLAPVSCSDVIKTICIFRIILKDKTIKIAAGRETALKDFQGLCFLAGANGMLIGGYLTIAGRSVEEDSKLLKEIKQLWAQ